MKNLIRGVALLLPLTLLLWGCEKENDQNGEGDNHTTQVEPDTLDCRTITTPTTLSNRGQGVDYLVPCEIDVEAPLTIEPGVTLAFEQGASLYINRAGSREGALIAEGTEQDSITFTGVLGLPGSWVGLDLNSGSIQNKLSHCIIEYAGAGKGDEPALLVRKGSKIIIEHCTFRDNNYRGLQVAPNTLLEGFQQNSFLRNDDYPIRVPASQVTYLDAATRFADNALSEIYVQNGSIYDRGYVRGSGHEWTALSIPYFVDQDLNVTGQLTIAKGCQISFSNDKWLNVEDNGAILKVEGTRLQKVSITGRAGKGSWNGIYIASSSPENIIEYATIADGGQNKKGWYMNNSANISVGYLDNPDRIIISETTIRNSAGCGIVKEPGAIVSRSKITYEENSSGNFCQ